MGHETVVLPTMCGLFSNTKPREILERAGATFLKPVEDNQTLWYVSLPYGWKKSSGLHHLLPKLWDNKGRERATIFENWHWPYITLNIRFHFARDYKLEQAENLIVACVYDREEVVHKTQAFPITPKTEDERKHNLRLRVEEDAEEWLQNHSPNWKNPSAYWD